MMLRSLRLYSPDFNTQCTYGTQHVVTHVVGTAAGRTLPVLTLAFRRRIRHEAKIFRSVDPSPLSLLAITQTENLQMDNDESASYFL